MANNNLFRWNKGYSPAKSNNAKEESGVQAWIKRVQAASEDASMEAYGDTIPGIEDVGIMQPDDQAIYEAQELLDKWMQDQQMANLNLELEFKEEKWSSATKPMLNTLVDEIGDNESYGLSEDGHILTQKPCSQHLVAYDEDNDIDYEQEAQRMFQKFMSNTTVETRIMSDLGMDKVTTKFKDPRPKMEQRHQMVKEKNKARKEKIQSSKRDKIIRKDAEIIARKKIQEEEKARKMKQQKEEAAIQRQMTMIRKEMEEEKLRAKEEQERKQNAIRIAEEEMRFETRRKEVLKKEEEERRKMAEERMRRRIKSEVEEKSLQEAARNMRLMHKVFSAWYSIVIENRAMVGKARAMFDWRCKLRAWNAWRAYINHLKSCKEAEEIAILMKMNYRKERMAMDHFRLKTLRRCLVSWHSWAKEGCRLDEIKREHQKKALKMAAFLEAAANGKLWDESSEKNKEMTDSCTREKSARAEVNGKIDAIFQSEDKKKGRPPSSRRIKSRPLSMTFKKKEVTEISKNEEYDSDRKRSLNVQKSRLNREHRQDEARDELFKKTVVASEDECPQSKAAMKRISHKFEEGIEISNETRLDLNGICSEPVIKALESDERESNRYKEELMSRKPTIRSEKPATKPVLLPMEERAKQRAERKAMLDEKKKRQDEEKLERLKLEQEKLMLAEMQMKKDRLQQKREEERIKKEREFEKQKKQEEFKAACKKADEHHSINLLRHFGINPWKRLVEIKKLNEQIAVKYHSRTVFRGVIEAWKEFADENKREKMNLADDCYRIILLRRSITAWQKYGKHYDILEDLARRHSASVLVKKYFQTWQYFVTNERLAFWSNEERAEEHDERRVLKSAMNRWKLYINELKEERKRQKRKDELRKKVKEWLPDFSS